MSDFDARLAAGLSKAVKHYWRTRTLQLRKQGAATGTKDAGNRAAVTGGAQLNGFIALIGELLRESGIPKADIHTIQTVLPGFYRPTKEWDLVVVADGTLLATIEVKSHAGPSFGNNFNNRIEEALGSATDFWATYREGAFKPSMRPFLGYLMLLEDAPGSVTPVRDARPHFQMFKEFWNSSYAKRYQLFCQKILRDRLYDAACFLMADRVSGLKGLYVEPDEELSFKNFAAGLMGKAATFVKQRGS